MKRVIAFLALGIFLSTASFALAKDYQVTGPVVDVKDDVIIVKKGHRKLGDRSGQEHQNLRGNQKRRSSDGQV